MSLTKPAVAFARSRAMSSTHDYVLPIEEVAKRLNKSVRTIHRYKDGGRLSFEFGETQGNPLLFSRKEVEQLREELYPNLAPSPPGEDAFWGRLERVERLLGVLEANPLLERLVSGPVSDLEAPARAQVETALAELGAAPRGTASLSRRELGLMLVRLGQALLSEDDAAGATPVVEPASA